MLLFNIGIGLIKNKLFYLTIGGILLIQLLGCQAAMIPIDKISSQKHGKTVYLTGRVIHLAPFIGEGAYQLQDSGGKIWVVTQNPLPVKDKQIKIKGKIEYQSLPFADSDLGDFYVIEIERLPLEP
jgi:hypothetical protein